MTNQTARFKIVPHSTASQYSVAFAIHASNLFNQGNNGVIGIKGVIRSNLACSGLFPTDDALARDHKHYKNAV